MRTYQLLVISFFISVLAACGDDGGIALPDASGDTGVGTDGGGTDGGGTDGGGTDGGAADGAADGGAADGAADGGAADGAADGGAADGAADGGAADGGGGIACGRDTCDVRTEQCCVTGGPGGMLMSSCIPARDMCAGGSADCDGPEDCGGRDVCCAMGGAGSGVSVSCVAPRMCTGGIGGGQEVCHDASDCTDSGDMCCPFMFSGISVSICSARCLATM